MSARFVPIALRPVNGDADLPGVVEVQNRRARVDTWEHVTTLAELQSDFQRPELNPSHDVRIAVAGERVLGYALVRASNSAKPWELTLELQTDIDAPAEVEPALVCWSLQRAEQLGAELQCPVELLTFSPEPRVDRICVLRRFGFEAVRILVSLQCDLRTGAEPPPALPGFVIRPLAGLAELPDWITAVNAAFADHWRFAKLSFSGAAHFLSHDPSYRPAGDLVAVAPNGAIAGICQCVLRRNECDFRQPLEGAIAWLGVRPPFRGQGVGRALLRQGLHWLAEQGVTTAHLGTDAEGATAALSLYQQVGFQTIAQRFAFQWQSTNFALPTTCSEFSHQLSPC